MLNVFANRSSRSDFVISELERRGVSGREVFIATAFFIESAVIGRLLDKAAR